MPISLDDLRRFTVARSLFKPVTLKRALQKMEYVQADPIRAPARAQDLVLRHRVKNYEVGQLERSYSKLDIEEDFFQNYGFVTRSLQKLMHPRSEFRVPAEDTRLPLPAVRRKQAQFLLEFVREQGEVHPSDVNNHFSHGTVKNFWGGSSNATTHLMDEMHYRGLLRVARRENGIRIYSVHQHEPGPTDAAESRARIDALADLVVRLYAPLPGPTLSFSVRRLCYAAPQWRREMTGALHRVKERISHTRIDGVDWYWPANEKPSRSVPDEQVRFLAPFDPVVRDRQRFELLWGWVYRFEAYTPAAKRKLGYYALPLLWRDNVIGWGNLSVQNGELTSEIGYVGSPPRERAFKQELEAEVNRMKEFLKLSS